ncbi:hypothetical protein BCR33DRAFT_460634 [Rhizoclosmatium globosum]|uniref:Uncharacterized protein n=1 Tax=Rhizoclosmatium globosum TaxID=329046 RepID=A0A1Y2CX63_9FUNG|nr:hypothetical protein BCR33DRAFT_460634 [Rhizoclosmatium globosum]|eukprot:ORY51629.1 hypothetical protein BCR33DRAFT_460634 [Rhizoclosmatium globosum]
MGQTADSLEGRVQRSYPTRVFYSPSMFNLVPDIHHSIFLDSKKHEESLLPPLQIHPDVITTNAVYSEDPAFDHKVQAKLKKIQIPIPQKVNPTLFERLSNPKRPSTPPLPSDVLVALTKPKPVDKEFFNRLYSERLHKQEHDDDDEDICYIGKGKHIHPDTINRLSVPKKIKKEERPVLPSIGKKASDVDALVGRLSKPRYYIVWKKGQGAAHQHHHHQKETEVEEE